MALSRVVPCLHGDRHVCLVTWVRIGGGENIEWSVY